MQPPSYSLSQQVCRRCCLKPCHLSPSNHCADTYLPLLRCCVPSGDWTFLAACPHIVHLHLSNNPMRGFLRLPPLPHLRSVDCSGSDISGCDGLAACPLLERVVLFHTQMAEAPPAGVVMSSVCELFLNNCKLTWLRECPSLPHLRYLSLADNRYAAAASSKHMHCCISN